MCHFIFCGLLLCFYIKTILSSNSSILREKRDASDDADNFNNNYYYDRVNAAILNNESILTDYPNLGHSDYKILERIFRFNEIEDLYKSVYYMLELKMSVDAIRYFTEKEIVEAICDSSITSDVLNEENRNLLPIVLKIAGEYIDRTRTSEKRGQLESFVKSNEATFIKNTLLSQIVCIRKAFGGKNFKTLTDFFTLANNTRYIKFFNEAKNNICNITPNEFPNRDRFAKLCGSAKNLFDVVFQIDGDISNIPFLKDNEKYREPTRDETLLEEILCHKNLHYSHYMILRSIFNFYSAETLYKSAYYLSELNANETAKRYFCNLNFFNAICDASTTVNPVEELDDALLRILLEVATIYINRKKSYKRHQKLKGLIDFNVNTFANRFLKSKSELMHVAFNGMRFNRPSDLLVLTTAIDLPNIEKQCKFIYYISRLNLSVFYNNPELLRDLTIRICGTDEFLKNKEMLNKRFIFKLLTIARNIIVTYFGVERYNEIKNEIDKNISDYNKCTLLGDDNEAEIFSLIDKVLKVKLYIDANLFSKDEGKHTQPKNEEVLLEEIIGYNTNDAIYFPNINNDLNSNSDDAIYFPNINNDLNSNSDDAIYFSNITNDLNSNSGFDFSNYVVPAPYNEAESSNNGADYSNNNNLYSKSGLNFLNYRAAATDFKINTPHSEPTQLNPTSSTFMEPPFKKSNYRPDWRSL